MSKQDREDLNKDIDNPNEELEASWEELKEIAESNQPLASDFWDGDDSWCE